MDTLPPFSSNSGFREQKSVYSLFSSWVRPLVIWGDRECRSFMEKWCHSEFLRCLAAFDTHLIAVKGAVVVHDVHGTAVKKISQSSHFVRCD